MRALRPLRALRYSDAAIERYGNALLASGAQPPDDLAERPPISAARLRFPERRPDDRSKYVQFARTSAAIEQGRREHMLALTEVGYGWVWGEFPALLGLAALDDLPATEAAAPDEARLRLLEATWTQLEPVVLAVPALPDEAACGEEWWLDGWRVRWAAGDPGVSLEHVTLVRGKETLAAARRFREERGAVRTPRPDDDVLVALVPAAASDQLPTGLAFYSLRDA